MIYCILLKKMETHWRSPIYKDRPAERRTRFRAPRPRHPRTRRCDVGAEQPSRTSGHLQGALAADRSRAVERLRADAEERALRLDRVGHGGAQEHPGGAGGGGDPGAEPTPGERLGRGEPHAAVGEEPKDDPLA